MSYSSSAQTFTADIAAAITRREIKSGINVRVTSARWNRPIGGGSDAEVARIAPAGRVTADSVKLGINVLLTQNDKTFVLAGVKELWQSKCGIVATELWNFFDPIAIDAI